MASWYLDAQGDSYLALQFLALLKAEPTPARNSLRMVTKKAQFQLPLVMCLSLRFTQGMFGCFGIRSAFLIKLLVGHLTLLAHCPKCCKSWWEIKTTTVRFHICFLSFISSHKFDWRRSPIVQIHAIHAQITFLYMYAQVFPKSIISYYVYVL